MNVATNLPSRRPGSFAKLLAVPLAATLMAMFFVAHAGETRNVELLWEVLLRSPHYGTTFNWVYGHYQESDTLDQLLSRCERLVEEEPENADYHRLLGMVYRRNGDGASAEKMFRAARRLDPDDSVSAAYLGESLVALKRFPEAVEALEESLKLKPPKTDLRKLLLVLIVCYEELGKTQKAAEMQKLFETLFPPEEELNAEIAEIYRAAGQFDKALARYELLVSKNDNEFAVARFSLAAADIKFQLGRGREALEDLETLLKRLDPENPMFDRMIGYRNELLGRLASLCENKGDFVSAARFQERLHRHSRHSVDVERLFVLYDRAGETDKAELAFFHLALRPGNFEQKLSAIDRMIARGRYDAVERVLDFLEIHDGARDEFLLRRWAVDCFRSLTPTALHTKK